MGGNLVYSHSHDWFKYGYRALTTVCELTNVGKDKDLPEKASGDGRDQQPSPKASPGRVTEA